VRKTTGRRGIEGSPSLTDVAASTLPLLSPEAAGKAVRALLVFSRSANTLTQWMMQLCVLSSLVQETLKKRTEKMRGFIRTQTSKFQKELSKMVELPPTEEDVAQLLKSLRDHNLALPQGTSAEQVTCLKPPQVRELFAIENKSTFPVPFGAELAVRIFRTWDLRGEAAKPGSGIIKTEFQTSWKKLEYLTPLSWDAIPKEIKEHPLLKGVFTREVIEKLTSEREPVDDNGDE